MTFPTDHPILGAEAARFTRNYSRTYFKPYYPPKKWRMRVALGRLPDPHYPRGTATDPNAVWEGEAVRERRIAENNKEWQDYQVLAIDSHLMGATLRKAEEGLLSSVIAFATNAPSLIPLATVLTAFERLALEREDLDATDTSLRQASDNEFVALVLVHTWTLRSTSSIARVMSSRNNPTSDRPTPFDRLRDALLDVLTPQFELFYYDFHEFVRETGVSATQQLLYGVCPPFEPTLLDAHAVHHLFKNRGIDVQFPVYQSVYREPPAYDPHNNAYHAMARDSECDPPHVLDQHPSFPPPSYP
ncbi:hypothetical protein JCM8547_002498 [Rhodosporidiobolus lusitaniae]